MKKIYDYFSNMNRENKISHAFLIGNTNYLLCKDEIEKVLSDYIFKEKTSIDNNPDIIVLEPDGKTINKDQINELLANLSTTSQIHGKKAYIITNFDLLSDNLFNKLLKTIEEPFPNTYAFLITSNIDNVVKTIRSRCQEIFISSTIDYESDEKVSKIALDTINAIEKNELKTIGKNSDIYSIIVDRDLFKLVIKQMYNIYLSILYNKVGYIMNEKYDKISCSSVELLCKKILIINSLIQKSNININKDLFIDKLIVDLWRCNYENSIC